MKGTGEVTGNGTGTLMPIGGAEERVRNRTVLRRFVDICGSGAAHLAVIPTASRLETTGSDYERVFGELGAGRVTVMDLKERSDCEKERWIHCLEDSTGVFFTGGNQLRLSTIIGGTMLGDCIRSRFARGLNVGGTSAGAAILSEHMIAFGREGSSPRADMVTLAPGLGLTRELIIDQHFRQRDRLGRLVTALSYNPSAVGIGLDEDTAAIVTGDGTLEVCGSGAITIVDPSEVEYSSMDSARPEEPIAVIGLKMHMLVNGGTFDMKQRRACGAPEGKI